MMRIVLAWIGVAILLLAFFYLAAFAYPGMLLLWGIGRMIGAVNSTWWEFTKGWFTGEWL